MSHLDLPPLPPVVPPNLSEPLIARRRRHHVHVGRTRLTILALRRHLSILAFGGALVAFGSLIAAVPWGVHARHVQIERDGITTTATVTRHEVTGDEKGSTQHRIRYAFTLPDGTPSEGEDVSDPQGAEPLTIGDTLRVVYNSGNPENNHPVAGKTWIDDALGSIWTTTVLSIIGLVLVALGGHHLWDVAVRLPGRWHHLLEDGCEAEGHMVQIEAHHEVADKVRLHYAYVDRRGSPRQGVTAWVPRGLTAGWKYGDPGIVRYGRHDMEQSIWLGHGRLSFFR